MDLPFPRSFLLLLWRNSNLRFRINLAPSLSPFPSHFASYSERPFFIHRRSRSTVAATFVIALFFTASERRTMNECPYQTRVGKAPSLNRILRNFHACQGLLKDDFRCRNGSCKRHQCQGCVRAERRRPKAAIWGSKSPCKT